MAGFGGVAGGGSQRKPEERKSSLATTRMKGWLVGGRWSGSQHNFCRPSGVVPGKVCACCSDLYLCSELNNCEHLLGVQEAVCIAHTGLGSCRGPAPAWIGLLA